MESLQDSGLFLADSTARQINVSPQIAVPSVTSPLRTAYLGELLAQRRMLSATGGFFAPFAF